MNLWHRIKHWISYRYCSQCGLVEFSKPPVGHLAVSCAYPNGTLEIDLESIVAVAILYQNRIYSLPRPNRHHHLIQALRRSGFPINVVKDQGFITSAGRYVDRIEGRKLAIQSGQLETTILPRMLLSEDLW